MTAPSVGFRNGDLVAKNITFDYTTDPQPAQPGVITADGQLLIGCVTTVPTVAMTAGNLISSDGSITITYDFPDLDIKSMGGAGTLTQLTGNSGVATPSAGNINVVTANTTVKFLGSGSTLTQDFKPVNLAFGSTMPAVTGGLGNVGIGRNALISLANGNYNITIGEDCGTSIIGADNNIIIGHRAGQNLVYGQVNILIGDQAGKALNTTGVLNTGYVNCVIGSQAMIQCPEGQSNDVFGGGSAVLWTSNESGNLCISSFGAPGDNYTIRIGRQTNNSIAHTRCFISGIDRVTQTASSPVAINSSGQLSNLGFGTIGQTLTSGGAGISPTWQTPATGNLLPFALIGQLSVPARNTPYYYQLGGAGGFTAAYSNASKFIAPVTGTITRAFLYFTAGVLGTAETSSVYVYKNNVNAGTITSSVALNVGTSSYSNTGMAIAVTAGDLISIVWTTPNWVALPQQITANATVVISA